MNTNTKENTPVINEMFEAEGAEFFDKETSDKLFNIAAQNQGFANFQELAESYEKDGKITK